jgi:carbon-monoxide dehydrogenase medium subunit
MIPAPFDYELADSVEHAVELLGERDDTKLLAGGHSLIPLMRLRFARPAVLVDLGRLDSLRYVRDAGEQLTIGALTRHHDLKHDPLLQEHCPLVSHTAGLIGDPQVRHRGTIGGSVAHGDPASDLPAVLLALDADLVVQGPDGERTVPADAFFRGVFETALGPQDVLTEIRVPKLGPSGWSYLKFTRRAQDWATVGVAAVVRRSNGTIEERAIALTNMGPTPVRARAAEGALRKADDVAAAAEVAAAESDPPSDTSGSADYRRHLATVLARRALEEAISR